METNTENQTHTAAPRPRHASSEVFDRKHVGLPTEKCAIEIFTAGEWIPCEWNPRTPESRGDAGYIGTARTFTRIPARRSVQIGFHAWEQNDSEFRYFCFPAKGCRDKLKFLRCCGRNKMR